MLAEPAGSTLAAKKRRHRKVNLSTYDDENRLISFNYATGESGTGIYGYAYDYRTRRVMRTEPGPVTTHLVFDGGVSILEYTTSAGSPTVEYVRGPDFGRPHTPESQKDHHTSHGHHHHSAGGGVGGLEYSIRDEAPSYNFYDSRGDVTTQTDSTGAVSYQTAYEAFGNQTATSGSTLDRQKASTKEQDPTGLLNEGFRYRDPSAGTFLPRDPLLTTFMMGIDKWYLDGKKVSKREYQRAIAPIIFDLESHPDKSAKKSGEDAPSGRSLGRTRHSKAKKPLPFRCRGTSECLRLRCSKSLDQIRS